MLFLCAAQIHRSFSHSVSFESSLLLGVRYLVRLVGLGGSQGNGRSVTFRLGL